MISATLWNSAAFSAGVLIFVVVLLRVPLRAIALSGLSVLLGLAVSSAVMGALPETTPIYLSLFARFASFAVLLGCIYVSASRYLVLGQILWVWLVMDTVFVVSFGAWPGIADYLRGWTMGYILMPFVVFLFMKLSTLVFPLRAAE
ncbi:MAG: hypothetical protein AAF393_07460 [Pseudomonadota bacterium]